MLSLNFFFNQCDFGGDTTGNYYEYLGYYHQDDKRSKRVDGKFCPVILYFGRDELAFYYRYSEHDCESANGTENKNDSEQLLKVYSLYVAEGELNQLRLTRKVEDYFLNPLWRYNDIFTIDVNRNFLQTGFFLLYNELQFDFDDQVVKPAPWFPENTIKEPLCSDNKALDLTYSEIVEAGARQVSKENNHYVWKVDEKNKSRICSNSINFQRLLLDFLFELEFATTFEGKNFFSLQPILQNNKLLNALTLKCNYLHHLKKCADWRREDRLISLPKPFLDAEKDWLNVCCLADHQDVFSSPKSPFDDSESEVSKVFFDNCIGVGRKKRRQLFSNDHDCATLRNHVVSFFMRQYDIMKAWDLMFSPVFKIALIVLLFLVPTGDLLLSKSGFTGNITGLFSFLIPLLFFLFMVYTYVKRKINLFKLMLPRLFLGVMIGWAEFVGGEELWKSALEKSPISVIVLSTVILLLLFCYVFTDINNKLTYLGSWQTFKRSAIVLLFALVISLTQGFYVLQFHADSMLDNSGFITLDNEQLFTFSDDRKQFREEIDNLTESQKSIPLVKLVDWKPEYGKVEYKTKRGKGTLIFKRRDQWKDSFLKISNYCYLPFPIKWEWKGGICYVWSIILSQLVLSILTGVVLQLLWEDRPITEPL